MTPKKMSKRADVQRILFKLKEELRQVKKTDVVAVSQLAEKAWVLLKNYVAMKSGTEVKEQKIFRHQVSKLAERDKEIEIVYKNTFQLHLFHYSPAIDEVSQLKDIVSYINDVVLAIQRRLKGDAA